MTFTADLHIHSRFAMGVSPKLDLATLSYWAKLKGIDLLATGDFTHPIWLAELRSQLQPEAGGVLSYDGVQFILGTEVSCVYQQGGRTRRLHLLVYAPDFETVGRLRKGLSPWGSLDSDGRPTLSLSAHDVVQIALEADQRCVVIPAHAWTPWFGVYGSKAGFDSLAECFGDLLPHIHAIETGLSSDPGMNWRVPDLDGMAIVSFSDAHSAPRLGREATVFDAGLTYDGFREAVTEGHVAYTLEFYPEEGKYHYDGHRKCGVHQHPEDTATQDGRCPVCKRRLTVGVASRIEDLSARPVEVRRSADGLLHGGEGRAPYRRLVALHEIIGEAMGRGPATKGVEAVYMRLVQEVAPELTLLRETPLDLLEAVAGERVAEGVDRARRGDVHIEPGYDGVYGTVSIWERASFADMQANDLQAKLL